MLIQLIYISTPVVPVEIAVQDFIPVAMRNNTFKNITGFIISDESAYVQVLEGDQEDVDELFMKIKSDPRHTRIDLVRYEPLEKRQFKKWGMRYVFLPREVKISSLNAAQAISTLYQTADTELARRTKKIISLSFANIALALLLVFNLGPIIERAMFPPLKALNATVISKSENTADLLITGSRTNRKSCVNDGIDVQVYSNGVRQESGTKILNLSPQQDDRFVAELSVVFKDADQYSIKILSKCHPVWDIRQNVEINN